ncbi:hypothetical protein EBR96_08045, partial [bacterium]|nr:hypothetical protein [bacterium]
MITPILFVILVANLILVTYLVIRVRSIANLLNETNSGTAELLQRINQAETSLDKSLIHVMSVVQQGLQAQRDDALTISKQLRDDIQNTSSLH